MYRIWLLFDPRRTLVALFTFLFASIIIYNYVVLHEFFGSFPHALVWGTSGTYTEPFHLSPFAHIHRRPEVRRYRMLLETQVRWPDGVEKTVITINGERLTLFKTHFRALFLAQDNFRVRLWKPVPVTHLKSL